MVFAPVSCFYMDDAKTVNLDDKTYINPADPPGEITELTATTTIEDVSMTNPYVRIAFSIPADRSTLLFGSGNSINLEFEGTTLDYTIAYTADPDPAVLTEDTSAINLIINKLSIYAGGSLRIILTDAIKMGANNSISLIPVDISHTIGD